MTDMRFIARATRFGRPPGSQDADEEAAGLPTPKLVKLRARRAAGIAEAAQTLAHLPGPGESLHAIMTARLDMTDVVNALLAKLGRCDRAMVATLGYNRRNFRMIVHWLDSGAIGSLSILASRFFQSHNGDLALETVEELRRRGHRAVFCPCHCKVMALEFASGVSMAIEGSANLCSNGSAREQFALINDPELCAWHARWIDQLVTRYEGKAPKAE